MLVQIISQNLLKTLCIFHKMICKSKKFFIYTGPFSLLHLEFFANRFCFTNLNPEYHQNSFTEHPLSSFFLNSRLFICFYVKNSRYMGSCTSFLLIGPNPKFHVLQRPFQMRPCYPFYLLLIWLKYYLYE